MSDDELLALHELCQALLDGRLSEAESARLEALLKSSPEARRFYVRTCGLAASLHSYAAELQTEAPAPHIVEMPPWRRRAWWAAGSLAAAALLTLGLIVAQSIHRGRGATLARVESSSDAEAEETVARIVGMKDCRWTRQSHQPGDELRAGERLELASGFAEVSFDSGAQVTIEGPVSFEVSNAWEASLLQGALRANVPPESAGFRIVNASVDVVDLGTEFSMLAEEGGSAEVFVLKGAVEATPTDAASGGRLLLHEKQSRRFARNGVGEVRDRDKKFARFLRRVALDRVLRPAHYVRWSFDEQTEGGFASKAVGLPPVTLETDSASPAILADGRWGGALRLQDGRRWHAATGAWTASPSQTVAFWVRVPAGEPSPRAEPLLRWDTLLPRPAHLALRWNSDPARGVLGALQSELGRGFRTGTTPLRDGAWHHVAVACSPGSKPGRFQLKQYVDARLEPSSAHRPLKHAAAAAPALAPALMLGNSSADFRADLDELVVADRVLSPKEIRSLMHQNVLPASASPQTVALEDSGETP